MYTEKTVCRVVRSGRAIFSHVKIALGKISRTLPRNFNALLTTSPHHISTGIEKFADDFDDVVNFSGDAKDAF